MAARPHRAKGKKTDYARLNAVGTTEEPLEEGQIQDSPLSVHASGDEFDFQHGAVGGAIDERYLTDKWGDVSLDYMDDVQKSQRDAVSVVTVTTESTLQSEIPQGEGEGDLGLDEVWQR